LLLGACAVRQLPLGEYAGRTGWPVVGGGYDNIKYSALTQVNTSNVGQLEVAWRYDSGEAFAGSEMQTNPIVIGTTLYAITPKQRLIALGAADGQLLWKFDPHGGKDYGGASRNRGVAYWSDGSAATIFYAVGSSLYAVDAANGKVRTDFGAGGHVDLREGLGRDPESISANATSPGVVYGDLLIIGSSTGEDLPAAPGDIRAYDVRTGALRWSFHTIPAAGEAGDETWPAGARETSGSVNSWSGLSLDVARGIVFVPTGSAAFDFWGGDRPGDNLYANSLVALRAATGERIWSFQTVRHDIWDRDLPTPPSLVRVHRDGRAVDAVAQITKTGYVYLFERETGKSLFPLGEMPVPPSDIPGEHSPASQPYPLAPPPFARQQFDLDEVTDRTPEARAAVLKRLETMRYGRLWEPPSMQGTVIFPGLDGGGEWGGAAFDPGSGLLYVNSNQMAWIERIVAREQPQGAVQSARQLYETNCAGCHQADLRGSPPDFPSLRALKGRLTAAEVVRTIGHGRGRMPAFAGLGTDAVQAIADYLLTGASREATVAAEGGNRLPFGHDGYNRFLDPDGYAAIRPPWGLLTAIDLERGTIAWQVPLGEVPELAARGLRNTGSENYGGPVVTAGGLLFIGATTLDRQLRAFDKKTGRLLWQTTLPFSATATPAVYAVGGRQYVVIGCGGGKAGQPSGATYIAFALPQG
jgi:quinoprotein glucose dehydrogenase